MLPLAGFDVLLYFRSALFNVVVTSFVGSSGLSCFSGFLFTVAWFVITFVNVPSSSVFTVTSKLIVVSPSVLSCFAGTFTFSPLAKSFAVFSLKFMSSSSML